MAKFICRGCGVEFEPQSKHYRFCSEKCKAQYWNKRAKKFKHTCPTCKKEFEGTKKQKYCSPECWLNSTERKKKPKKDSRNKGSTEKVCLWCHGKYKGNSLQLYCSYECGVQYRDMRQKIFKKHPFEDTTKLIIELQEKGQFFKLR
jgi:hypothetical protein